MMVMLGPLAKGIPVLELGGVGKIYTHFCLVLAVVLAGIMVVVGAVGAVGTVSVVVVPVVVLALLTLLILCPFAVFWDCLPKGVCLPKLPKLSKLCQYLLFFSEYMFKLINLFCFNFVMSVLFNFIDEI